MRRHNHRPLSLRQFQQDGIERQAQLLEDRLTVFGVSDPASQASHKQILRLFSGEDKGHEFFVFFVHFQERMLVFWDRLRSPSPSKPVKVWDVAGGFGIQRI